jgi:hypothetical protein
MLSIRKAMPLVLLPALLACGDVTSPSHSLSPTSLSRSSSGDNNASRPGVTGHATAQMPEYGNAPLFYDIVAIRRPNNTIDGRLALAVAFPSGPVVIEGDPVCFTVVGNTSRLAARVVRTNSADLPTGSYVIWSVVDNHPDGERQSGGRKPDLSTFFAKVLTNVEADWHCTVGINIGPFHPVQGNLTVHEQGQ